MGLDPRAGGEAAASFRSRTQSASDRPRVPSASSSCVRRVTVSVRNKGFSLLLQFPMRHRRRHSDRFFRWRMSEASAVFRMGR